MLDVWFVSRSHNSAKNNHIPQSKAVVSKLLRYIDDVLMEWNRTTELTECMQNERNIRLTYSYHEVTLPLLDLQISIERPKITTKMFRKETATNTLLQAQSHHPRSLIHGILMGQFLKIKRNCSNDHDFKDEAMEMYQRFRKRGYSHISIREARNKAGKCKQETLLVASKKRRRSRSKGISKNSHKIWFTVEKHWHGLTISPLISDIL